MASFAEKWLATPMLVEHMQQVAGFLPKGTTHGSDLDVGDVRKSRSVCDVVVMLAGRPVNKPRYICLVEVKNEMSSFAYLQACAYYHQYAVDRREECKGRFFDINWPMLLLIIDGPFIMALHEGGFVFGDYRLGNVLRRKGDGRLLLCDVNWAGKEGEATYPQRINPKILWPDRVVAGGAIAKAHDMACLDRHLKGEPEAEPIDLSKLLAA